MALETVTYVKLGLDGSAEGTVTGVLALRRGMTRGRSNGGNPRRGRFHLQANTIPDWEVRIGDALLDADAVRWVIESAALLTLGTRWQLDVVEELEEVSP